MKYSKNILYISPHIHYVYTGWMYMFEKSFKKLSIFSNGINIDKFGEFNKFSPKKTYGLFMNFFNTYDNGVIKYNKKDIFIVGDLFCMNTCFYLTGKNVFYYSEYFSYKKSFLKKITSTIYIFLFFRNKNILVPTRQAFNTFKVFTKNIYYLPSIYYGNINKNKKNNYETIKLLFVGRISNKFKNIDLLIDTYLGLGNKNIELTLVGEVLDTSFYEKHEKYIESGKINLMEYVDNSKLDDIYMSHDIFILASHHDPIGQVVLEAMSNGNAIIVSDTVGASSYIEDGINGYVFKSNSQKDLKMKLENLISDTNKLNNFKKNSIEILKKNYRYNTESVVEKYSSIFM